MSRHYIETHDVPVISRKLVFNSQEEFNNWRSSLEATEKCRFVSTGGGVQKTKHKIITTLRCFRDGFFFSKGQGKRHIKQKKSCKFGGICPAGITASQDRCTGLVSVSYIETHVGHEAEVGRLNLSKAERKDISVRIAEGVPFDTILDDVRNSTKVESISEISRLHLLTRKDLWNISKSYNLKCTSAGHKNDTASVASWITEMQGNSNIVRFYKPQNSLLPDCVDLLEMDFVLIIASDTQLEFLMQYGPKCVCFDSTHGFNQSGFDLTTLLVLNQANQGFPCAFMVSNRYDAQIFKLFVDSLKSALGFSFQPDFMMTDIGENFFNGWCQVMPVPKRILFCCWHIDQAWRKNLKKVSGLDKKKDVYRKIRSLLEHRDEDTFLELLGSTINDLLNDADTRKFGEYFVAEYSSNYKSWSFCYRKRYGINCSMHLESIHKMIKHLYLSEKKAKRLDKGLLAVMKFSRDKLFDILISEMRGKLTPKIVATRKRHDASFELENVPITSTEAGWLIPAQDGHEIYRISRHNDDYCSCEDICEDCRICVHSYKCTCPDSTIEGNICKHIHRLRMFVPYEESSPAPPDELVEDDLDVDVKPNLVKIEGEAGLSDSLSPNLNSKPSTFDEGLMKRKEKTMQHIMEIFDRITSDVHADIFDNALRPVIPAIEATNSRLPRLKNGQYM